MNRAESYQSEAVLGLRSFPVLLQIEEEEEDEDDKGEDEEEGAHEEEEGRARTRII